MLQKLCQDEHCINAYSIGVTVLLKFLKILSLDKIKLSYNNISYTALLHLSHLMYLTQSDKRRLMAFQPSDFKAS